LDKVSKRNYTSFRDNQQPHLPRENQELLRLIVPLLSDQLCPKKEKKAGTTLFHPRRQHFQVFLVFSKTIRMTFRTKWPLHSTEYKRLRESTNRPDQNPRVHLPPDYQLIKATAPNDFHPIHKLHMGLAIQF